MGENVPNLPPFFACACGDVVRHNNSALLFDDNYGEGGLGTSGNEDDDDLNALMDRGLAEIDDLLSTKGRLSIIRSPQASSLEGETAKTGDHRPPPGAGGDERDNDALTTAEHTVPAAAGGDGGGGGGQENSSGGVGRPGLNPAQTPKHRNARGTGANAVSVLMSATAPTGSAGAADTPSFLGPGSTNREGLGGSSSGVATNGDSRALSSNGQAPHGSEEVTRPREGVRCYVYEARALHGGGNTDHVYSPPRRREKEAAPFIQAKGLTLTHTQAKLFGLAGSSRPPVGVTKGGLRPSITWPGSRTQSQPTGGTERTVLGGSARKGRHRQSQPIPRRTFSPSRMEQLSSPVPGRGRFSDSCTEGGSSADRQHQGGGGRGSNAPFTWKRSRRAEAAMR